VRFVQLRTRIAIAAHGTGGARRSGMTNTSQLTSLSITDLTRTTGGAGGAPLSGDVTQQINTNWGGTQIINPAQPKPPTTVLEYRKQHPELRIGSPRPIRR
jgi:hypothetical protein